MDDSDLVITLLSSDEEDGDTSTGPVSKPFHSCKRKRNPSPTRPELEELKLPTTFASTEEAAAALFGPPPSPPADQGTLQQDQNGASQPTGSGGASLEHPPQSKRPRPNRRPPPRPKRPAAKTEGSKPISSIADADDGDSLFDMSERIEHIAPAQQGVHAPIIRSIFTGHAPSVLIADSDDDDEPIAPVILSSMAPTSPTRHRDSPSLRRSVTPPPGPAPTMPTIVTQAPLTLSVSERSSSPFHSSTAAVSSSSHTSNRTVALRILSVDNHLEQEHIGSMTMGGDQTFGSLFDELQRRSRFPCESFLLARGGTILASVATPDMLGFLAKETLYVFPNKDTYDRYQHAVAEQQRVTAPVSMPPPPTQTLTPTPPPAEEDDGAGNKIRLKIRDKEGRELKTAVLSSRPFRVLLVAFCKKFNMPVGKLRLFDPDDEPLDLDEVIGETVEDEDQLTVK